jgi:hypothetical protein
VPDPCLKNGVNKRGIRVDKEGPEVGQVRDDGGWVWDIACRVKERRGDK